MIGSNGHTGYRIRHGFNQPPFAPVEAHESVHISTGLMGMDS
jgi:hypothetical protein